MSKIFFHSKWSEKEIDSLFSSLKNHSFKKDVHFYIDMIPKKREENSLMVALFVEPPEIASQLCGNINNEILQHANNFDYIFTHNQDILEKIPNKSVLYAYGTTWVNDFVFPVEKKFQITSLVGGKTMSEGHKYRNELLKHIGLSFNPIKIYNSRNNPIQDQNISKNFPTLNGSKNEMFDSQFHIVIENVKRRNWFTEKVMDAFQTKTIPIYWGCPNIGDWFDIRGMILVENVEDIIKECNKLTPETYEAMRPYVEKNFETSKKYLNLGENLKKHIEKILKKQK